MNRTCFVVGLIVLLLTTALVAQGPVTPRGFDLNSIVYGKTLAEWSAAWWQWAYSMPYNNHPLFDTADCNAGQSGPVFFLGGQFCQTGQSCSGTFERACTITGRKALYFPVLNVEDSAPEEPNWGCGDIGATQAGTIAEMRACVESFLAGSKYLSVSIDGKQVFPINHVRSIEFEVSMPDNNFLTGIGEGPFNGGRYSPVVDEGYYVMLPPLAPGEHTLHFHGQWSWGSTLDATYHLTILK